ncbi:hypothetical protein AB6A40_008459 [Gnathostoma spinigerum]|uniref:Uncharacterized protein n=1 Tax=Gnathostoma spinigerum TaxID=75299 RepID=A0ABD6EZJ7_9BILA
MSDLSDFDEGADAILLKSIRLIGEDVSRKKKLIVKKTTAGKVVADQLINAIHSTKNLNDVKKQMKFRDSRKKRGKPITLSAPLYRQAREKMEGVVALKEVRRELNKWSSVVEGNRTADQLSFPLDSDKLRVETGSERVAAFMPRTPLEIEMAKIIGTSKNNLRNDEELTEAEAELVRAMSVREASYD